MPIYEFTCSKCDARFEKLVRAMSASTNAEKVPCPECGSTKTARTFSVFAAVSAQSKSSAAPSCGRCGGAPGSCMSGE